MSVASFPFLLFCLVLTAVYYILPACSSYGSRLLSAGRRVAGREDTVSRRKAHRQAQDCGVQWIILLVFSLFFYTRSGWAGFVFMAITTAATYLAALWMERENAASQRRLSEISGGQVRQEKAREREQTKRKKRRFFTLMCVPVFGIWVVLKYGAMLVSTAQSLLPAADFSAAQLRAESFILPLGLSFYTFNAAGYVIDVSRKKYPAERNIFKYLLFLSFFAHIVQGPFSRYDRLGKDLFRRHRLKAANLTAGAERMLFGFMEKYLIADRMAKAIAASMSGMEDNPGVFLFLAILGYGIQLYADFRGYMDIVCGICRMLDIRLEENFRQPYFSVSLRDYWTRWHVTLGNWYTDYIFYPASMGHTAQRLGRRSRKLFGARMGKLIPGYFAMIFVWTLTGLWHGASWTYVIWGWLNFAVIVFSMQMEPVYGALKKGLRIDSGSRALKLWQMLRTVLVVSLLRIFYCSASVDEALRYIRLMLTPNYHELLLHPVMLLEQVWVGSGKGISLFFVLGGTLLMLISDILKEKGKELKIPWPLRAALWALLFCLVLLGYKGSASGTSTFMYANF